MELITDHSWSSSSQWVDMCEAFLIEARWCSGKVVPNLEDYLSNGVTTAGTYMALVHAFYLMGSKISRENSELVASRPELFASAGRILRLWDDLGTAKVRFFLSPTFERPRSCDRFSH